MTSCSVENLINAANGSKVTCLVKSMGSLILPKTVSSWKKTISREDSVYPPRRTFTLLVARLGPSSEEVNDEAILHVVQGKGGIGIFF